RARAGGSGCLDAALGGLLEVAGRLETAAQVEKQLGRGVLPGGGHGVAGDAQVALDLGLAVHLGVQVAAVDDPGGQRAGGELEGGLARTGDDLLVDAALPLGPLTAEHPAGLVDIGGASSV